MDEKRPQVRRICMSKHFRDSNDAYTVGKVLKDNGFDLNKPIRSVESLEAFDTIEFSQLIDDTNPAPFEPRKEQPIGQYNYLNHDYVKKEIMNPQKPLMDYQEKMIAGFVGLKNKGFIPDERMKLYGIKHNKYPRLQEVDALLLEQLKKLGGLKKDFEEEKEPPPEPEPYKPEGQLEFYKNL